jgi:uncharacterized membrane protein YsdA (DUF1294 family)/cold shock CspA family protein
MRKQGTVVRWDAARGFGFIRSPATSADIFFHKQDFRDTATPHEGLAVTFEEIHVGGKGPRAMAVQAAAHAPGVAPIGAPARRASAQADRRSRATANSSRQRPPGRSAVAPAAASAGLVLLLMAIYTALLLWAVWQARLPWWVLPASFILNLLAFFAYWTDKQAAQTGQWRTKENTLHLFSLLGGWPGAWFAQQILRHKSSKASFRAVYWATVVLHCMALSSWLFWLPVRNLLPN